MATGTSARAPSPKGSSQVQPPRVGALLLGCLRSGHQGSDEQERKGGRAGARACDSRGQEGPHRSCSPAGQAHERGPCAAGSSQFSEAKWPCPRRPGSPPQPSPSPPRPPLVPKETGTSFHPPSTHCGQSSQGSRGSGDAGAVCPCRRTRSPDHRLHGPETKRQQQPRDPTPAPGTSVQAQGVQPLPGCSAARAPRLGVSPWRRAGGRPPLSPQLGVGRTARRPCICLAEDDSPHPEPPSLT